MKKKIDVTVEVSANEFCDARDCTFCCFGSCGLFVQYLEKAEERGKYLKCQPCLDALEKSEHGVRNEN